jgi:activator of HSP90 ATPase
VTPAIEQSARFACSPEELFELYMDSAKHSAATGARARVSRKPGGSFTAFEGALSGRMLLVAPNQMIVQTWRSTALKSGDPDAILVLCFGKAAGGSQIDLVQVNVAPQDHKGVTKRWPKFYWKPWKSYLASRKRKG